MWNDLNMTQRNELIKLYLNNGISSLDKMKEHYNSFADGGGPIKKGTVGELVDALYKATKRDVFLGEPSHHYDFTQSEEWANAHGYYPDSRGHRDDRVKKPTHPSHPSRGTWNGDYYELTDKGLDNVNYTLFGLNDGGQDSQAILTYKRSRVLPAITVTPEGNYIENPYDNRRLYFATCGTVDGPDNPEKKPKFKQSKEQYYDRNNDIIYAQDSIGEGYQHEYFHARPNTALLNNLRPYYENLNDNRLIELGADLPFVKRLDNDPNHFYSPEEIGARVTAARYMLNKAGINTIDIDFLRNARKNELQYGDNFRDLLHMYNDENLLQILNTQYSKGGHLYQVEGKLK